VHRADRPGSERSFDALVEEAASAPIDGWDFGWLEGRASEERPPWGYAGLVAERARGVAAMLDLQTGGGELLAGLPALPSLLVATEAHVPNVAVADRRLRPRGAHVVHARDEALPFGDGRFELVTSRHPVATAWGEVARVLRRGGTYLSQQVGPDSVGELSAWLLGPVPPSTARRPERVRAAAQEAGLVVDHLRTARLRTVFDDVGAVVYFLRLVVWIVPGFDVERFRPRLVALHHCIADEGPFVAHATRMLIEAHKP